MPDVSRELAAELSDTPPAPFREPRRISAQNLLGGAILAALMLAVYYPVLIKLVLDWWQIPDNSHGFLVPLFAAYLVWTRRRELRQARLVPHWAGVPIVVFGLLAVVVGELGAELFLARISFPIVLAGLTLCFGGWEFLRLLCFPLLILLLAIPIPAILMNQVTLPLQILASKAASHLLPHFGVPVLREGNVIALPSMRLEVAEACSGIRSLVSLLTLAVFYGYFMEEKVLYRILLVLSAIPIALAANAIRIVGTGLCVQYWDPEKALGFFHEFSGWVIFVVSLICLVAAHRLLSLTKNFGKAR